MAVDVQIEIRGQVVVSGHSRGPAVRSSEPLDLGEKKAEAADGTRWLQKSGKGQRGTKASSYMTRPPWILNVYIHRRPGFKQLVFTPDVWAGCASSELAWACGG